MSQDIFHGDRNTTVIYRHDGFSSTILASFSPPDTPYSLVWANKDLYAGSQLKFWHFDGFSSTLLETIDTPGSDNEGMTWDGEHFYSCDDGNNRIYKHDGFSTTILQSISSPSTGPRGVTWDGNNLIYCDTVSDKIYKLDGFSTTILASFDAPSTAVAGLTWDGEHLYSCDFSTNRIYQHDGCSSTILSSIGTTDYVKGLAHEYTATYGHPVIESGSIALDNSYCKIIFSGLLYSDPVATQTINKDDLSLIFTQNEGGASAVSLVGLYEDAALTTPLAEGTGYDTVYVKLGISGFPTGVETIEIKPVSASAIYDASGHALLDTETTGALTLYNVPASIIKGVMASDNAYVEIDFSEDVWADSDNTAELTPDSFLVDFQQNGGGISGASINALFLDAGLTTPLASGAGYSIVFAQIVSTSSGFPTGAETIEIKPKDGSSIYDSSGDPINAAETTGILYFNAAGSTVSLNWSSFDPVISALRSIISLFLVSLFGHGLHVFFTDKALFQEVENDLHTRISSLPASNQALGIELLNFFQRYYGK